MKVATRVGTVKRTSRDQVEGFHNIECLTLS